MGRAIRPWHSRVKARRPAARSCRPPFRRPPPPRRRPAARARASWPSSLPALSRRRRRGRAAAPRRTTPAPLTVRSWAAATPDRRFAVRC